MNHHGSSNFLTFNWIWGLLIHSSDQTDFRLDSMSYGFLTFVIKLSGYIMSHALIHLNPYIPVVSYHEDFTCDIMPWTRDTVRNWFNNWGWHDNNRWKFWSLLCFYFIRAGILCSWYIYITFLSIGVGYIYLFSHYRVKGLNLLHTSYFTQFYRHSKKHPKVTILVVLNIGALL